MANFYGNDPFFNNDMDDVFNQLFRLISEEATSGTPFIRKKEV
ncbi:MAG: hypothetical protein SO076_06070 [Enterococcus faecium]|nr:hypothetical protein [Enterococcus faecium]